MATILFDHPLFIQRNKHVEEIAGLEDALELLESWPSDQRGLAYETLLSACRRAASGSFPAEAIRNNLERFLRKARKLVEVDEVRRFGLIGKERRIGSQ